MVLFVIHELSYRHSISLELQFYLFQHFLQSWFFLSSMNYRTSHNFGCLHLLLVLHLQDHPQGIALLEVFLIPESWNLISMKHCQKQVGELRH